MTRCWEAMCSLAGTRKLKSRPPLCYLVYVLQRLLLIPGLVIWLANPVEAERPIPLDSGRAVVNGIDYPKLKLGSNWVRLAPGVRIYDQADHMIFPTAVPERAHVAYQLEKNTGLIMKLWLLSAAEDKLSPPRGAR